MDYTLDVSTVDGLTLVSVVLDNTAPIDRRVRVENHLGGPVLPPRRRGVPESGWDEMGYEGTIPAESTRALGYSCPVVPDGDAEDVEVVSVEVLGRAVEDSEMTPDDVVRELGPSRPPADVVSVSPAVESTNRSANDESSPTESEPTATDGDVADAVADVPIRETPVSPTPNTAKAEVLPADLHAYFEALERQLELAECLEGVGVSDAATILTESDADPTSLPHLDAERETLRQIAARATALADRAAKVSPTTDALGRVA
ncbi:hypothetical protein [Haloferax sp. DFSO60]|uniref:DUF7857 domain-containing protein n=1 Tax=Haloferax sp. DFSO60 TaxID=3388652 RepID=UPI00397D2CBF